MRGELPTNSSTIKKRASPAPACTRGQTWRKLSEAERAHLDEASALALMARYPTLIRRPVLDTGKTLLIGFTPETYAQALPEKPAE